MSYLEKICANGAFCEICRSKKRGAKARKSWIDSGIAPFSSVDFPCPHGKPWVAAEPHDPAFLTQITVGATDRSPEIQSALSRQKASRVENFFTSTDCLSGKLCVLCRELVGGRAFRGSLRRRYPTTPIRDVDFECPYGKKFVGVRSSSSTSSASATPESPASEPESGVSLVSAITRIGEAITSTAKTSLGFGVVSENHYAARMDRCRFCPSGLARYKNGKLWTCGKMLQSLIASNQKACGCILSQKAKDLSQKCPQGHWEDIDHEYQNRQ